MAKKQPEEKKERNRSIFKPDVIKSKWRKNKKFKRPKAFETPDELWRYACEYFIYIDEHPYQKQEPIKSGDYAGSIMTVDSIRPYTWNGLEIYLFQKGIIYDLQDYKRNTDDRYTEYKEVIGAIDKVIFDQKFSGAAVGAFNANIIARELGLADNQKVEVVKEQPLFADETENDEDNKDE